MLVAAAMAALLVIAALVIDLSQVRLTRQTDKSAADFAAAAGIRNLDDGSGAIQPWRGICAARDYLEANSAELQGLTYEFAWADDPDDLVADMCAPPNLTFCMDGNQATWGILRGRSADGSIQVTIRNGYSLPDPSFAEDVDEYAGDNGTGPCDHLAVVVENTDEAAFGGVADRDSYSTRRRSVARLVEGIEGEVPAALLLLEREKCATVLASGSSTARVVVGGTEESPGVIHSDSNALGSDCSTSNPVFRVNGGSPPPRIVAENAPEADDDGVVQPGQVSSRSVLNGGGGLALTYSNTNDTCAQEVDSDCGDPSSGLAPVGRQLQTRRLLDERYLSHVRALKATKADTYFAWTTAAPPPSGTWTVINSGPGCSNSAHTFTAQNIWLNCGSTGDFNGNNKTFAATVDRVVINGQVTFTGTGNVLQFIDVAELFVKGNGANSITTGQNSFIVNDGGLADCAARRTAAPEALTQFVIGSGRLSVNNGTLRLCQTTLVMLDNSGGCPLPTVIGTAPADNSCTGNLGVGGTTVIDWSAPNVNDLTAPTDDQLANFEDLALWSETSGGSGPSQWSIRGGGGLKLSGVFFTPNADPVTIGGGGVIDIEDAVFVTRRLEAAGNGTLRMVARAANAIPVTVLGGYSLVR